MIKRKRNIEIICDKMKWRTPLFCDAGANGYLTWKRGTQEEIKEIEEKTGIQCSLTYNNRIIVPFYIGK